MPATSKIKSGVTTACGNRQIMPLIAAIKISIMVLAARQAFVIWCLTDGVILAYGHHTSIVIIVMILIVWTNAQIMPVTSTQKNGATAELGPM